MDHRALIAACATGLALAACAPGEAERGRRLFDGEAALEARLAGHRAPLPALASRCSNCHARDAAAPPAFASLLSQRRLVALSSRRGGPPSRFDAASLCTLLRSGVDPAEVMVAQAMPRYAIADADCRALWAYLDRAG